jgi:hypothetical protein
MTGDSGGLLRHEPGVEDLLAAPVTIATGTSVFPTLELDMAAVSARCVAVESADQRPLP